MVYPDLQRDDGVPCPRCGCCATDVLDVRTRDGRRFSPAGPVPVRSSTSRLKCGHCGHTWTTGTPWETIPADESDA